MDAMLHIEPTEHPHATAQPSARWQALQVWEQPWWSALLAMSVYTLVAAYRGSLWHASNYPYFNYLADAFNHGQLHLRMVPPTTLDLSYLNGHYYLYWPPFPAVLLMPFVAIFGIDFSDVLFTIGIAGLNVALVALLLRRACARRVIALDTVQRAVLVLFFALGTVHLTLGPYGRVWWTSQLIGFACVALTYLAALSLRGTPAFACAGITMAAALVTRNHLVLAGVWPAWYVLHQHWREGWPRVLRYTLIGMVPVVIAVGVLGVYNAARFGSPTDNGLAYHRMAAFFAADYARYGAFSLHYLPTNLYYQYVFYPFPLTDRSYLGGSLFLLSPIFFGALWGVVAGITGSRTQRAPGVAPGWSRGMLAVSIMLPALPILLLMGTGWVQWGPRYTLDFTVPLLLLTALGIRRWPRWLVVVLLAISIVHYLVGTIYLGPKM